MFENYVREDAFQEQDVLDSLLELEKSAEQAFLGVRTHERIEVRTQVTVRPGNSSERESSSLKAVSVDISRGGCMLIVSRPLTAGDVYWLSFDDERLSIGSMLARSMRCRLVREELFECGFRFFDPVELPGSLPSAN